MQLISKFNIEIRFSIMVLQITNTNAFQIKLITFNRKPNKI